jgi:hypothetical protein
MRLKDELTKNSLISKKEDPSAEEEKVLRVQIESISEQRNKEIEALQQKISEVFNYTYKMFI